MVLAGELDRLHEALEAQLLQPRLVEVEVLEALAHVLGVDHLLAGEALGGGDRLGDQDRVHHAAIVEVLADPLAAR